MIYPNIKIPLGLALAVVTTVAFGDEIKVNLSGTQENPPVSSAASATGVIVINADGAVSGSITTKDISATVAHIHTGSVGKNGPVIIPLTKTSENDWSVQAGARLNDEQIKSYKAGDLYVNVHSKTNPGGEIRAQITP